MMSVLKPLRIIFKSENNSDEMIDFMKQLQQYSPVIETMKLRYIPSMDKTREVTSGIGKPVLFGGDQLTVARARGAQKAKVHATSLLSRLDGLVPMIEVAC